MTEKLTEALWRVKQHLHRSPESIDPGDLMDKYRSDIKSINREKGTDHRVFFNPISLLDRQEIVDAYRADIEAATNDIHNAYALIVCRNYLVWALALDRGEAIALKYPDLFEPLLQIVESGIPFGIHNGDLIVGHLAFPR